MTFLPKGWFKLHYDKNHVVLQVPDQTRLKFTLGLLNIKTDEIEKTANVLVYVTGELISNRRKKKEKRTSRLRIPQQKIFLLTWKGFP